MIARNCATCAAWLAIANPPEHAVIDLKMPDPSGLVLVQRLKALDAETRIVMLTGYASIATAVEAIKLGARTISPNQPTRTKLSQRQCATRLTLICQ